MGTLKFISKLSNKPLTIKKNEKRRSEMLLQFTALEKEVLSASPERLTTLKTNIQTKIIPDCTECISAFKGRNDTTAKEERLLARLHISLCSELMKSIIKKL